MMRATAVAKVAATKTGRTFLILGLLAGGGCASKQPVGSARPAELASPPPADAPPSADPALSLPPGLAPVPIADSPPAAPAGAAPVAASPASADGAGEPAALPPPPPLPIVGCTALKGANALRRSALVRTLDAGLGAWLSGVDIEPKVVRGRFQGWLIQSIYAGDPCWSDIDLRAGDVVVRVNRRPIHSPDEAQAVWTALRSAREIAVDFLRDGKSQTLRFPVVDDRE